MKEFIDKLIERLEEKMTIERTFKRSKYSHGVPYGYADAIKTINELAEEYKGGWIPCSERLPSREEYQNCNGQFIVSDGNRTYATYFDIYDTLKFGEPTMDKFKIDKCVIAWQPLPASYTEGE